MQSYEMEQLFNEWEKHLRKRGIKDELAKDGIVDSENYKNVVWILRETNGFDRDLTTLIKDSIENPKKHSKYWKTPGMHHKASLAVAGLLHPTLSIEDVKKMKKSGYRYAAIANIKKTKGKESSNIDEIVSFFKEDKGLLKRQIEMLKPKVVIVGGMKTIKRIRNGMISLFDLEEKESDVYFSKELNAYFIATYHPSFREIKFEDWITYFQDLSQRYAMI